MSPSQNPYAAPATEDSARLPSGPQAAVHPLDAIGRRVFRDWERLRLVYIAVLAVETIALATLRGVLTDPRLLVQIAVGAVVANVLFFLGPAAETYVVWIGGPGGLVRRVLFTLGLLVACGLAAGVVWFGL